MILFRCNAGPEIGFGHLARCRALAAALAAQGARCGMAGPETAYMTDDDAMLFDIWQPVPGWTCAEADAAGFVALARAHNAREAVLDDYRVDETYQLVLREAGLRWLQFEARMDVPIWADLVLNANPAARAEDYAPMLRNPATRLLLGPGHAILRPEFAAAPRRAPRAAVTEVLVAFGAGDDRGAIRFVLEALLPATSGKVRFTVVSGRHNPANDALSSWIVQRGEGRVRLLIDPPSMAETMTGCDLAVTSGGTLTYELAACGVPMAILAISDDQERSRAWQDAGVALFLGRYPGVAAGAFVEAVLGLAGDFETRRRLAAAATRTTDGCGAARIALAMRDLDCEVQDQ
ncbi:MAG: UDP-2,4-diacetamido-2,4,6-trideoxy-beta-L-altropyranose hydrolase [Parvibaculum sp.]|nr:UDP-2,4-diacetamido-2,4,6-trideoxy-beta-L-altropyranose hydrolase [Parvibaculum sp.]